MKNLAAVILAAGEGKRMKSRVSKVLHEVSTRPMIDWVIEAARDAGAQECICLLYTSSAKIFKRCPIFGCKILYLSWKFGSRNDAEL